MEKECTFVEDIITVCHYITTIHKETCQCPVCLAAMRLLNEVEITKTMIDVEKRAKDLDPKIAKLINKHFWELV